MSPQAPRGQQAQGRTKIQLAIRTLEDSLSMVGADSEDGKAVLKAITSLVKVAGRDEERSQAILPAEMKNALLNTGSQPGSPPAPPAPGGGALPPGGAPAGRLA